MAAMTSLVSMAQSSPMVLSDNHAMLRVTQDKKYILLPVQEKEEIAAIAVLDDDNEMVKRLNVKLTSRNLQYRQYLKTVKSLNLQSQRIFQNLTSSLTATR